MPRAVPAALAAAAGPASIRGASRATTAAALGGCRNLLEVPACSDLGCAAAAESTLLASGGATVSCWDDMTPQQLEGPRAHRDFHGRALRATQLLVPVEGTLETLATLPWWPASILVVSNCCGEPLPPTSWPCWPGSRPAQARWASSYFADVLRRSGAYPKRCSVTPVLLTCELTLSGRPCYWSGLQQGWARLPAPRSAPWLSEKPAAVRSPIQT